MTHVIVDDLLRTKLHNLTEALVLCDQSGQVFGHFVPIADLLQWEPVSPGVSEEELDRRARSNERRYSTAEVLSHLEGLSREEKP
ncbi:MAG TPA: hypothetical protein VFI31_16870 [Pirellulales bacterium]|nr:hypothetical protein [Pirellulales bacterium]